MARASLRYAHSTDSAVGVGVRCDKSGEIGPPDAMFLTREMDWREFGLIEWRVK